MRRYAVAILWSLLATSGLALANEPEADGMEEFHSNHVAIFAAGLTSELESNHTSYTMGTDYERRLSSRVGVGALADFVFEAERETLLAAAFVLHPRSSLRAWFAPGVALVEGSARRPFVARFGIGYDSELGRSTLSPTFNVDIVEGHLSLVYGVALGFGF